MFYDFYSLVTDPGYLSSTLVRSSSQGSSFWSGSRPLVSIPPVLSASPHAAAHFSKLAIPRIPAPIHKISHQARGSVLGGSRPISVEIGVLLRVSSGHRQWRDNIDL